MQDRYQIHRPKLKTKIINLYYQTIYELQSWNWTMICLSIISLELAVLMAISLQNQKLDADFSKNSLELLLTINGLFSAILVTYFFNRISWILSLKKETYEEAVEFSQKITEFRRICDKLTVHYNVWTDDHATKNLIEYGAYKHIDYYDFQMLSISDYKPSENEIELIEKLRNDTRYKSGMSDLFLGMISLVRDRKSRSFFKDRELYKDFQKKGIYNLEFIEKCVEVDYASRLGYSFNKNYGYIKYDALSKKSKEYILQACERIDTKYKGAELNNKLMSEICDDMNEHYFTELYQLLLDLRKGLSGMNLLIFSILIASTVFGVLLPFFIYFSVDNIELQQVLTSILVGLNFGLLFFFVTNLYGIIKREITWT